MCNKEVDHYRRALEFVLECYKIQKLCDKAVGTYPTTIKFVSLNAITFRKCMIKQLIDVFLHLILFLTGIKLK